MLHAYTYHRRVKVVVVILIAMLLAVAGVAVAQERAPSTEPDTARAVQSVERTVAYDSATSKGLPPDENVKAGSIRAPNAPAVTFRYYQVSGATLRGRNSATGYIYDGVGCSHVSVGTGTAES
jgi:hypothetical protein